MKSYITKHLGILLLASIATFIPIISYFTLIYFLFFPGYYLLRLVISNKKINRAELVALSLGLSILILITTGLLLNTLHIIGVDYPLSKQLVVGVVFAISLGLIVLNNTQAIHSPPFRSAQKLLKFEALYLSLLTLLPILTTLGAFRLNNGASNILTLIAYGSIAVLFLVGIFNTKFHKYNPYLIYCIALSLLLATSLRGWGITGHDIQREFFVYQLTSSAGYWDIASFRDPYNASLSITILPTILDRISGIAPVYIYKLIYQIVFAFSAVIVYGISNKLLTKSESLIAAFLFVSFPTFMGDMSMLNRQEIAFIFLGLILIVNFMNFHFKPKMALTIIFSIGVILSHYSTAYITILLFALSYLIVKLMNRVTASNGEHKKPLSPFLSPFVLITIVMGTFIWNFWLTDTTTFLKDTYNKTVYALVNGAESQSADTRYAILSNNSTTPEEMLYEYAQSNGVRNVEYKATPMMPPTSTGAFMASIGINVNTLHTYARFGINVILQLLLLAGTALLYWRVRKGSATKKEMYVFALSASSLILLAGFTLLPQITVSYGVLRLFQQSLFISSIAIVISLLSLLSYKNKFGLISSALLSSVFFLHLSGFIPQITGGYPAQLSLNNSGLYYDAYYTHPGEKLSAEWIAKNIDQASNKIVQTDDYTQLRLLGNVLTDKHEITSFLNSVQNSYQYFGYSNHRNGLFIANIQGTRIYYTAEDIPNRENNLIYSNSDSIIYRR